MGIHTLSPTSSPLCRGDTRRSATSHPYPYMLSLSTNGISAHIKASTVFWPETIGGIMQKRKTPYKTNTFAPPWRGAQNPLENNVFLNVAG